MGRSGGLRNGAWSAQQRLLPSGCGLYDCGDIWGYVPLRRRQPLAMENIKFDNGFRCFHIEFEKRKNDQYRQGSRVTVGDAPDGLMCPPQGTKKDDDAHWR